MFQFHSPSKDSVSLVGLDTATWYSDSEDEVRLVAFKKEPPTDTAPGQAEMKRPDALKQQRFGQ